MRPDCQLRAFNAEVTGSPIMVLLHCSHSCPPTLVPLFRDDGEGCGGWRTALSSQGISSPRTWCSSAISFSSFRSSLVILRRFPPRLGPWAYYPKWAGVPRSLGPTIVILIFFFLARSIKIFYTLDDYILIFICMHIYWILIKPKIIILNYNNLRK